MNLWMAAFPFIQSEINWTPAVGETTLKMHCGALQQTMLNHCALRVFKEKRGSEVSDIKWDIPNSISRSVQSFLEEEK
jgi:hypothetical protein